MVTSAREHIYDMKPLEEYVFRDEQGKDQGINGEGETEPHCVNKHCENILMSYSLTSVCVCVCVYIASVFSHDSLPVCLSLTLAPSISTPESEGDHSFPSG